MLGSPLPAPPVGSSASEIQGLHSGRHCRRCQNQLCTEQGLSRGFLRPSNLRKNCHKTAPRGKVAGATASEEFPAPEPPTLTGGTLLRAFRAKAWKPGSEHPFASAQQTDLHPLPTEARENGLYKKTYKVLELLKVQPSLLAVTRLEQSNDCSVSSQGRIRTPQMVLPGPWTT